MDWRDRLMDRYYRSRPDWRDGTTQFHEYIATAADRPDRCLEIGAGPENNTSHFLAGQFDCVDGLDIDPDVRNNSYLSETHVYDGGEFPIGDGIYDCAVANYVLEHVERPEIMMAEVLRVLKPGGCFVFRTPNKWHYVSVAARLIPNTFHDWIARRARHLPAGAHDAYPTYHRMNSSGCLRRLARRAGFVATTLETLEPQPSYMNFHPLAFRLGVVYERTVNRFGMLAGLRANLFGVMCKSGCDSEDRESAEFSRAAA